MNNDDDDEKVSKTEKKHTNDLNDNDKHREKIKQIVHA